MEVKCATSFDERFDPKNALDSRHPKSFWITTGLYPQEMLIAFKEPKLINNVNFVTTGAKRIRIEGCKQANA